MEELDYWRLCDELNIVQAALLVVGEAPNLAEYTEGWDVEKRPKGYEAAKTAISHALRKYVEYNKVWEEEISHPFETDHQRLESLLRRSIRGKYVPIYEYDINGNPLSPIEGSIDLKHSTVEVESLKEWLRYRGFTTGFFFPVSGDTPDYLDPSHSRYAPKLAAAVSAWLAVTDPGKVSPKKALDKWLREHASQFGLVDDEGNPNNQGVEECSKVANWNTSGGAPKTPNS